MRGQTLRDVLEATGGRETQRRSRHRRRRDMRRTRAICPASLGVDAVTLWRDVPLPSRECEPGFVFVGALAGSEGDVVACDGIVKAGEWVGRGLGWLGLLRVVCDASCPAKLREIVAKGLFGGHDRGQVDNTAIDPWTLSVLGSLHTAVRFIPQSSSTHTVSLRLLFVDNL